MNITRHTIIYCATKNLYNKVTEKYPEAICVYGNNKISDISIFEYSPDNYRQKWLNDHKTTWFTKRNNKWYGHDFLSQLENMSTYKLIKYVAEHPAFQFIASGILANRIHDYSDTDYDGTYLPDEIISICLEESPEHRNIWTNIKGPDEKQLEKYPDMTTYRAIAFAALNEDNIKRCIEALKR